MKIGILTLPLYTNYGGILQAYALQTILERMGHEVCFITKRRKPLNLPLWKMPYSYSKRILKNILGTPYPIFYEQKINRETSIIEQNTEKFIKRYIKQFIIEEFPHIHETDFDSIIVGSDQVWRPIYFEGLYDSNISNAFLKFTKKWNIKRIAYAASFGTDKWEYTKRQTDECRKLMKLFDAISVRESSGVGLCKKYFNIEAKHVLDPTMLLDKEDYVRLFKNTNTPKSKGTLLIYILDETQEKVKFVNKIASDAHLIPFRVNANVDNLFTSLENRIQPPIEQWLRGFYDAEYVVTDSFHACVFSILFNKPFIAIGNESRGMSRFSSLLETFGLTDRLITNLSSYKPNKNINWESVLYTLQEKRNEANTFLLRNYRN